MGLTKISISRPVFIFMLIVLSVLMGLFALQRMRVEENPEVQFGVITVTTVYPGAGPEEVANLVSRKIEEAISGVAGLNEVTSTSQEGVSIVIGQFEIGTNMDIALNDVRSQVDRIGSDLPTEIERPTVGKVDSASEPVLYMSASSDKLNPQELRDVIDDKIVDRFARIPGVATVSVTGGDEREVQVRLKADRMLSYGIGIVDVQRALQATSLNVPAGRMITDDREIAVRVSNEFASPEDVAATVIRVSDPQNAGQGATVRLTDIADVVDASVEKREYSRLNGQPSVVVVIQKSREGNAVEISHAAKGVIAAVESEYGVKLTKTQDTAVRVEESIFDLTFALVFGIILVTAIVHLFLHDWRGTLIVALAIPICLMATLMVLWALGFTLNNMSLLALSLAIGVLVDDAIVVLENIYRHLRMGEDPQTAALNGRGEIGLAAIAITLADVVVFLPLGFMGGVVGQFFKPLGIGFAVAVMLSLFVSFTVTPMLASRWYAAGEDIEAKRSRFAVWFDNAFDRFSDAYRRGLEWSLRHRWFVFISGFVVLLAVFVGIAGSNAGSAGAAAGGDFTRFMMIASVVIGLVSCIIASISYRKMMLRPLWGSMLFALVFPVSAVLGFQYGAWKGEDVFKFSFAPPADNGVVTIRMETAPGTSLEQTLERVKEIEKVAMEHPEAKFVLSEVGNWSGAFGGGGGTRGSNLAQLTIQLHEKQAILDVLQPWVKHDHPLRVRSSSSVAADLIQEVGKRPGLRTIISTSDSFGFGSPIQISLRSDDRALLQRTAADIRQRLENGEIQGVVSPDMSSKSGKPEVRVEPDELRMADANVSAAELSGVMRTLYEGNDDTQMRIRGREYPVRVMMDLDDRNNPDLMQSVPIGFDQGQPIYLDQVAKQVQTTSVDKVERRARQEEILITTELLQGFAAGSVQSQIDAWLVEQKLLPQGVEYKPLGQADVQAREGVYMITTLFIGLILVYMVLASLFDNLLYPFIVQLAQPQAFVGGLLALIITDKTLNIVGFIGLIALVGLVGKNAILLIDYTNTLRARGRDRHDAVVESGPTRLRPIMMTTLALVLGMLPVALAIGRGSEFRETLGIIIIGGISLSTLLTLFVIPCSYTIFDDLSERIRRKPGRGAGSGEPQELEEPVPVG